MNDAMYDAGRSRVHLIVSVDYEVFGDGSGRVDCCVLEPARRIAEAVTSYGGRLSIFVDVCEFQAMAAHPATEAAATAVVRQLRSLSRDGHRLELHLHPQWTGDVRLADARWRLDVGRWRIGDRPEPEVRQLVREGVQWLASVSDAAGRDPGPVAFRAGGWCVQPSAAVLGVLADAGFRVESSVAPGLWTAERQGWYDFRRHPPLPAWTVQRDVCAAEAGGPIWEVPIAVGRLPRLRHLRQVARSRGRFAPGCHGSYSRGGGRLGALASQLARLRRLGRAMLDYSTLDGPTLVDIARDWLRAHAGSGMPIPLVAIGHTKNFTADSATSLRHLLAWASGDERILLSDYRALTEDLLARP